MQHKECLGCNENKLLSGYHKSPTGKYGVKARCKICYNSDQLGAPTYEEEEIQKFRPLYTRAYLLLDRMLRSR